VLKITDNSSDYSIQNTARQTLFLPTSREAKYKAKAAIDAFFMRFGDVLQAGIVYLPSGDWSKTAERATRFLYSRASAAAIMNQTALKARLSAAK